MNGRSKEIPAFRRVYKRKQENTGKNRSFEEQQFDNVFFGVPYDEQKELTIESLEESFFCKHAKKDSKKTELLEKLDLLSLDKLGKPEGNFDNIGDFHGRTVVKNQDFSYDFPKRINNPLDSLSPGECLEKTLEREFASDSLKELSKRKTSVGPVLKPKPTKRKGKYIQVNSSKTLKENRQPFVSPADNLLSAGDCISYSKEVLEAPNSNFSISTQLAKTTRKFQNLAATESSPAKRPRPNTIMDEQAYQPLTNGDNLEDCNVATLLNMGNTCFLNSVLYALRFTPTFLHNLHHLLVDLSLMNGKLKENKTKTSSLGRNGSAVSGSSWRSASSKDLLSIGSNDVIPKSKPQIVTESLHALFVTMTNLEAKASSDAYQPEGLLQAVRDANSLFEGNHQQDAHEFFVELLSCLRVTCDKLNEQIEQHPDLVKSPERNSANVNNNSKIWGVRRSWKPLKKKGSSKKSGDLENDVAGADSEENLAKECSGDSMKKKLGYNFIAEDFQGISLHRTMCHQCEEISELKEPFLEIQVPVNYRDTEVDSYSIDSSIFGSICVTSEKLCDQNKYFCENCNRYNEAQRTVLYEKLPNIMVLHLKRFTTTLSGVQKVNTYVPTPLEIRCFCESCNKIENSKVTPHRYRLSCVIMHLGASIASGHYIAYSRAMIETGDYLECTRDIPKSYLTSSSKELSAAVLKFFKPKVLSNLSETQNGISNAKKSDNQFCQSMSCCGIRCKLNSSSRHDDWLEFDDEKVKTLSSKEFAEMLNKRHDTTNTPYLLFYSKV